MRKKDKQPIRGTSAMYPLSTNVNKTTHKHLNQHGIG